MPSTRAEPRPRGAAPGALPLVGRPIEVATLAAATARAVAGLGGVVVVEGEAGIGKTRLVQEVHDTAAAAGFEICAAAADEVERRRPFGVLADALRIDRAAPRHERRAQIARLLLGDDAAVPLDQVVATEFRVGEAVIDLVERACADRPQLLVLEDLHWADPSTLSCLARLARVC
ncbi:MAG: AAA family ATPase, partial [Pseudonocardia sp.]|nr:AAA family ATPase [Pseudonocardia sp.]